MMAADHSSIGERVAALENERVHTTAGFLNISARLDTLNTQLTEMRVEMLANASGERGYSRGFMAGLVAAAGLGGGLIGAKAQAIMQFLFQK